MKHHHFLLISLPAQGHINPILQLAKILTNTGAHVTFVTTDTGVSGLKSRPKYNGLSYASLSLGGENAKKRGDTTSYMADLKRVASEKLSKMIRDFADEGRPVTLLVYSIVLPWAPVVARELHVPSAFFASQNATVFQIYYKCFNSHDGVYDGVRIVDPLIPLKLPGLPLLVRNELPTFLFPDDDYFAMMVPILHDHIKNLEEDPHPRVLVNTFYDLEAASLEALKNHMNLVPIGPLIPSAFTDGNDPTDTRFGCDLFESSTSDYLKWLDSKAECSVIYVSFGSLVVLNKEQKLEIFHGLVENGRPFLWALRPSENEEDEIKAVVEKGIIGENGIIVPWCSQVEVLCNRKIGCFLTHSGWNSTMESLAAGVPMVACPHMSDQMTNSKMIEEVWGIGLRARGNEEGVVGKEEVKRCLDVLMGDGERGEEIRRNALKWRCLALDSVKEQGSSRNNLKMFLESLN